MEAIKRVSQWKPFIQPVLSSKVSEFKLLGYHQANEEELWNCLLQKIWEGNPEKKLHETVADIFHLNTGIYMNYITLQVYQDDNLLESFEELFRPHPE